MQTRTKLVALEFVASFLGWGWILACVASLYFLIAALAFGGRWSAFFWALGCSVIAKWLAGGFSDNESRVACEADLVSRGFSREEAGRAWLQAYSGGPDKLPEPIRRGNARSRPLEAALIAPARAAKSTERLSPEMLEHLRRGYASLADFVGSADAEAAEQFSNLVKAAANFGDASNQQRDEIAERLKDSRALEIQQRSNEEFARLVKEFDAAVGG